MTKQVWRKSWVTNRALLFGLVMGGVGCGQAVEATSSEDGIEDVAARSAALTSSLSRIATSLRSSYYVRNWGDGVYTQWSELNLQNPAGQTANVEIVIYHRNGSLTATLRKTIPAGGWWNSYGDSSWLTLPSTDANGASLGWIEVRSDQKITATNRIHYRKGTTYNAPIHSFQDEAMSYDAAQSLYANFYWKNWPSGNTSKQWTHPIVVNPSDRTAHARITVYKVDGSGVLATFTKAIAPHALWDSWGDADWDAIPSTDVSNARSRGWFQITSNVELVASNKLTLREGTSYDGSLTSWQIEPMVQEPRERLFSTFWFKNWPGGSGLTQWSDLVLNNPQDAPVTATIKVFRSDGGGLLSSFTRTIPAHAWWNSHGDSAWQALPETDTVNHRSSGWIEVKASAPLLGMNRKTFRSGTSHDAPLAMLDDQALDTGDFEPQFAGYFFANWPFSGTTTQWTNLLVNNPNPSATTVTIKVHNPDRGGVLKSFSKTIPANGSWNSHADADWTSVPSTAQFWSGAASNGWIEVIPSTNPVFSTSRLSVRNGTTFNAPVVAVDDVSLTKTQATLVSTASVDVPDAAIRAVRNKYFGCDPNASVACGPDLKNTIGMWDAMRRRLGRPTSWDPNARWCPNPERPSVQSAGWEWNDVQGGDETACRHYTKDDYSRPETDITRDVPIVGLGASPSRAPSTLVYFATFERGQIYAYQRNTEWRVFEIVDYDGANRHGDTFYTDRLSGANFYNLFARSIDREKQGTNSFLGLPNSGLEETADSYLMMFINGTCEYAVRLPKGGTTFTISKVAGPMDCPLSNAALPKPAVRFTINDVPLDAPNQANMGQKQSSYLRYVAERVVPRLYLDAPKGVRGTREDHIRKAAVTTWWSMKEGVLGYIDQNTTRKQLTTTAYSYCSTDSGDVLLNPWEKCGAGRAWQVGAAAVQVPDFTAAYVEQRAQRLFPSTPFRQLLSGTLADGGYASNVAWGEPILAGTDSVLRKSWLLRTSPVGFDLVFERVNGPCFVNATPAGWCFGPAAGNTWPGEINFGENRAEAQRSIADLEKLFDVLAP